MSNSNYLEELKSFKLRKSNEPTKDYSDPKLAGFTTESAVDKYKSELLECNVENWYYTIKDHTFRTEFCPIYLNDANLLVRIHEKLFKDKDQEEILKLKNWKDLISGEELDQILNLEARLQTFISKILTDKNYVFVKSSFRSPKDSPLISKNFQDFYLQYKKNLDNNQKENENEKMICLLKAAFDCMRVENSSQVLDMFVKSERIYQDMRLAIEKQGEFNENFIIREFVEMDVDMEFRGFVFNNRLTALSQYNFLIYSKKLNDKKDYIQEKILDLFYNQISIKLRSNGFLTNYAIDFALISNEIFVIEINPLSAADPALFNWSHERHILEDPNGFCFRITDRPQPGAKAMLPKHVRKLMETDSLFEH